MKNWRDFQTCNGEIHTMEIVSLWYNIFYHNLARRKNINSLFGLLCTIAGLKLASEISGGEIS